MAINSFYQKLAGDLKKLGLIDYDLRRNLSTGQKSRVRVLAKEYADVIGNPENYHIATVKSATKKELQKTGFKVTPTNRAIIPLGKYDKATIKKGRIVFESQTMREETYLAGAKDFEKMARKLEKKKLTKGQAITARVGSSANFNSTFNSFQDFIAYLNKWQPKDERKKDVMKRLSIVTVKNKSGEPLYATTKKRGGKGSRN